MMSTPRLPRIAGQWYPNDKEAIERLVDAPYITYKEKLPHPAVLLLPHAGYVFSGALVNDALERLPCEEYERIVILAPTHHCALENALSIEAAGEVETPFGLVEFSGTLREALCTLPGATHIPEAHAAEHAIDIQLPLLKRHLPHCVFGAALVGRFGFSSLADANRLRTLAAGLRRVLDAKTLLVISTDFTHAGPNYGYTPFETDTEHRLDWLDEHLFEAFASNSNRLWQRALEDFQATVCGASCMHAVLAALPQSARFQRIGYTTSSAMTGDCRNRVGYTTAAIYADWNAPMKALTYESVRAALSPAACNVLLDIACESVRCAVEKLPYTPAVPANALLPELMALRGAFVTLTKGRALRGCIGEILPRRSVMDVVGERARNAAIDDWRFTPVSREELQELSVEISVLTPPYRIDDYHAIRIGVDGIVLRKDGRSAVFLPQVALEQGWDVETTLAALSRKAGLAADAWRSEAVFEVFQAQVFGREHCFL